MQSEDQIQAFSTAKLDHVVTWLIHFLIEGEFYSLFSLLFGIGFALQMQRSATHEVHRMVMALTSLREMAADP